jgi:hypothetical protein
MNTLLTVGGVQPQVVANVAASPARRIIDYIASVISNIPVKPAVYGRTALDMSRLEPWYVAKNSDGKITVTVPSDIESFPDDPGVIAAIAAIGTLKAEIFVGGPMRDQPQKWVRCHEDTDLYYAGIAASLREEFVHSYPGYSGWFGKGYNLCVRRRLTQEGIKPWSIKGSTMPLRKVWTHKSWGETLPSGYKHLEVLLREASDCLILHEEASVSWMVPLSTIRGTKMRKSLATSKIGFLLRPDVDALNTRYATQIAAYESVQSEISKPGLSTFVELDQKIEQANRGIADLERAAGHIIDMRAKILYPPTKVKTKKKPKKTPIKEKLGELEPTVFINRFGPYEACGIVPFSTSDETLLTQEGNIRIVEISEQFRQYSERHPAWGDILMSWWNTEFLPRFG